MEHMVLGFEESELTSCPVLVDDSGDLSLCGEPLLLIVSKTVIGDDYGAWPEYDVEFACGHTISEMKSSLRMAEYV